MNPADFFRSAGTADPKSLRIIRRAHNDFTAIIAVKPAHPQRSRALRLVRRSPPPPPAGADKPAASRTSRFSPTVEPQRGGVLGGGGGGGGNTVAPPPPPPMGGFSHGGWGGPPVFAVDPSPECRRWIRAEWDPGFGSRNTDRESCVPVRHSRAWSNCLTAADLAVPTQQDREVPDVAVRMNLAVGIRWARSRDHEPSGSQPPSS